MFRSLVLENSKYEFVSVLECAEQEYDIAMQELNIMTEMVDKQLELNRKRADLKVYTEQGTLEDLSFLYEEAEKEANTQKEGLLNTVSTKVGKFFETIWSAFTGLFTKTNTLTEEQKNKELELTAEETELLSYAESAKKVLPKVFTIVSSLVASAATAAVVRPQWDKIKGVFTKKPKTSNSGNTETSGNNSGENTSGDSGAKEAENTGSETNKPAKSGGLKSKVGELLGRMDLISKTKADIGKIMSLINKFAAGNNAIKNGNDQQQDSNGSQDGEKGALLSDIAQTLGEFGKTILGIPKDIGKKVLGMFHFGSNNGEGSGNNSGENTSGTKEEGTDENKTGNNPQNNGGEPKEEGGNKKETETKESGDGFEDVISGSELVQEASDYLGEVFAIIDAL